MKLGAHSLTLRQLQYVVAVAQEKSFHRAADSCHVSQPSLSAQVAEAENALGVRLFERDRRRVLITAAGAEIVARAREILVATDELLEVAKRHVDPLAGRLRIGVIPTIGPYLLPKVDPALRHAFPRIELLWTEDKTATLVSLVQAGELDAALVALESDLGDLEHAVVGRDPFVVAASPQHALGRKSTRVRLADLPAANVLLLEDGHCFGEQAFDLCSQAGANELGFRATSLPTLCQMVAGGTGVTLLPRLAVEVENRRDLLRIREFVRPAPHRTIILAWRRRSALASSLRQVAAASRAAFEGKEQTRAT